MNISRYIAAVAMALLLVGASLTRLSAQITVDQTVTTFDKLSKTIIPFAAPSKPAVTIEPNLEGLFTVEYANGQGQIIVPTPVAMGKYTITLTDGNKKTTVVWKVLASTLTPESLNNLASLHFYYGKRIALRQKLLSGADIPFEQFKIEYQIGSRQSVRNAYAESWDSPYIPAAAKQFSLAVVWRYPPTGEPIVLFEKKATPEQLPPSISSDDIRVTVRSYDPIARTMTVNVEGMAVAPIPMDADELNPNENKAIVGGWRNVEFSDFFIDNGESTSLVISAIKASGGSSAWKADTTTLVVREASATSLSFAITFRNLPPTTPSEWRSVRGTVGLRFTAKSINRKAGISSIAQKQSLTIPLSFTYGATLSANELRKLHTEAHTNALTLFAQKPEIFRGKNALRRLENYRFGGYALYELDSLATKRLREHLITTIPYTPAIAAAEHDCPTSDEIKQKIRAGNIVPQYLMDESPDCETVKQYWELQARVGGIQRMVAVVNMRGGKQELIGVVSTVSSKRPPSQSAPLSLSEELNMPFAAGILEQSDVQNLPTQVVEQNEKTKKPALVQGSIEGTTFKTMGAYIMGNITAGRFKDFTEEVMLFPAVKK